MNKEQLVDYLKTKMSKGDVEDHEIIVALCAMYVDGKIRVSDIGIMIMKIFSHDMGRINKAMKRASPFMDDDTLETIVYRVHQRGRHQE